MRILGMVLAATLGVGAAAQSDGQPAVSPDALDMPSYQEPATAWKDLEDAEPDQQGQCRDRIRRAREEAGQPELDRQTASPDEPLLIWAVDHRRENCGVLVMMGDPDDMRPVPESDESGSMIPAQTTGEN